MAARYEIICNRAEGPLAVSDDLAHASRIVGALIETRGEPMSNGEYWLDYWIRDEFGGEYYWDADWGACFFASCFAAEAA
jgi:hypothetical protein